VCTSGEKRVTERRKKALAKLASKVKKLLANFKFHSHLASWRVAISTPPIHLDVYLQRRDGYVRYIKIIILIFEISVHLLFAYKQVSICLQSPLCFFSLQTENQDLQSIFFHF
jgi:hypothetical protein